VGDVFWLSKVGKHLTTICAIDFILKGIFFFLKWKFIALFLRFFDRMNRMGQDKEIWVSPQRHGGHREEVSFFVCRETTTNKKVSAYGETYKSC